MFLLLLGMAIGLGAGTFIGRMSFGGPVGRALRLLAGLVMILFGLWQARGRSPSSRLLDRALRPLWERHFRWRRSQTTVSHVLFGFGYILAGLG